jgi:TPP-dependent indolepyruvate ferredoxin oxidoreductase alpha subunit
MSTIGDVLSGVKKVLLLEESVARIEKNFDKLGEDVRRTRDYADSIDRRVTRLEGFIEGATAASGQQARLPKE